jgi:uncharacterized protein YbjT (DUF2867 family)
MLSKPVLVTGATGYVGGRLVPRLLDAGWRVRAMGRSFEKLACRPWAHHANVELVQADMLDPGSLEQAVDGCDSIFYLVHSMIAKHTKFVDADRRSARNMADAAARAGAGRIIYLSGLGQSSHASISKHLRSRHEVGEILQAGPVPVTVLRAAMILGSGSASFEILRYLVERLPLMITPRWVHTPSQPIAIGNVLGYLIGCLEHVETVGRTYDIGGPNVLSYKDLIDIFAEEAQLPKRRVFPVPVLTPHLSSLWIHLITPVPASIAVPLTEGLGVPTTCREGRIRSVIPQRLASCRETIRLALDRIRQEQVETCWADAGALHPPEWAHCGDADYAGGTVLECGYRVRIGASAAEVWQPVVKIGGKTGYYFGNAIWRLRGLLDRMVGGVGLRRGRRHASQLLVGDALDFWRVLEVDAPRRLLLLAEMKTPGEALLDVKIEPVGDNATELQLHSRFLPKGLAGLLYWYALYPFHQWVFRDMLKAIAKTIGKPMLSEPKRFTPKLPAACKLRDKNLTADQ